MILILDTETTGTTNPVPVEIAWVALGHLDGLRGSYAGVDFHRRFRPGVPITYGAMATHHLTEEDVADCPPAAGFRLPEDTTYLIGHNIDFDWQALLACGPQPEGIKRICTLALSRSLWPESDSHSLAAMVYMLRPGAARILCPHAHGAEADVELTSVLLAEILAALPEVETVEQLWWVSEEARIPTIIPYGKHKGVPIAKVPADYVRWLLGQPDVDPYLRQALLAEIGVLGRGADCVEAIARPTQDGADRIAKAGS